MARAFLALLLVASCTDATSSSTPPTGDADAGREDWTGFYTGLCEFGARCEPTLGPAVSDVETCVAALLTPHDCGWNLLAGLVAQAVLDACGSAFAQAPCSRRAIQEAAEDCGYVGALRGGGATVGEPCMFATCDPGLLCRHSQIGNDRCASCVALPALSEPCFSSCADGSYCDDTDHCASLLAEGQPCSRDSHCASDACVCADASCAAFECGEPSGPTGPCVDDEDCIGSYICAAGICGERAITSASCVENDDCLIHDNCVNQVCTPIICEPTKGQPGGVCLFVQHCPSGYFCDYLQNGTCQPVTALTAPCDRDAECGVGAYCYADVCELLVAVDADCSASQRCMGDAYCGGDGLCHAKKPDGQPCVEDGECTERYCIAGTCNPPPACE